MTSTQLWLQVVRLSKKAFALLAAALLLLSVSSCDFFRTLAGRPGSAEIRQKQELILRAEAMRDSLDRARLDSAARAERFYADSLYAVDTLTRTGRLRKASAIKSIPQKDLDHRYCLVVGAFSQPSNAERLVTRYSEAGFNAFVFRYHGGMSGVCVEPCDRIDEALEAYRRVMRLPFASRQTWVLVNE